MVAKLLVFLFLTATAPLSAHEESNLDLSGNWKLYISSDEVDFPPFFSLTITKRRADSPNIYNVDCNTKIDDHGFYSVEITERGGRKRLAWTWLSPSGEAKTQYAFFELGNIPNKILLGVDHNEEFLETGFLERK